MRKFQWLIIILLIGGIVAFASCRRMEQMLDPMMPDAERIEPPEPTEMPPEMMEETIEEMIEMPVNLVDVLIYTNRSFWITLEDAEMAAETTKRLLDSHGVQVQITKNDAYVREWMLHTTGDGSMNVIVLYGVLPAAVYGTGNSQPDGSIAENWIETMDGDTILNHADYIAYNTDYDVDKITEWNPVMADGPIEADEVLAVGSNVEQGLQNLMDNFNISLFAPVPDPRVIGRSTGGPISMMVTSDGMALTPSLVDFESYRPIPLNQLQGEWFAEKVFASDTGNAEAIYADPVILRDGDQGRLAIVHATTEYEGLLNGEVAAEIILNHLLAPPMMTTVETSPEPMVEIEPAETTETPMEPAETTDLHGGTVDIEDAMSTVGLRKIYWIPVSSNRSSLLRSNPDGSGVETLFAERDDLNSYYVGNLVVDSEGGKTYWNNTSDVHSGGGVWCANLDGSNLERIVTTPVRSFSLDLEARKIYWATDDRNHLFHRSNLDGSGVEKFNTHTIAALIEGVHGIAFEPINHKIYVIGDRNMYVINADDLDIKFADMESEWNIGGYGSLKESVTLDIEDRKIYWVISGGNSQGVYRVNLDGTNSENVLTGYREGQPTFTDLAATFDFNTRKIYWSGGGDAKNIIWQTNLDGSGSEGLFAVGYPLSHIAVEVGPTN